MESLDTGKRLRRERDRHRRRDQRLPSLRPRRRQRGGPRRRHRASRRRQPGRARAGRRVRADHAVELPAAAGVLEGRAGPRRRLHVRAQAERALPAHRDPPDASCSTRPGSRPVSATSSLGDGPNAGAPLSEDPRVDLVSFTGGLGTGKRIMAAASGTVKKVALELGGKNPNIVFADADRATALDMAMTAVFLHSGQVCSAGARLVVEESIAEEFVAELVERARDIRLGGPFDEKAETGALISQGHLDKVTAYVEAGVAEGAEVLVGGKRATEGELANGLLLRADHPRRRTQRDERGARRVVRSGAHRRDVHRRGRRRTHRQRLDLRARRRRLDPGRRQGPARRRPDAHGHGLDQRLPPLRRPGRVGRLQAVRHRARARAGRPRGVPGDQARLAQHRARAVGLVRRWVSA